jgi:hypothetical protein
MMLGEVREFWPKPIMWLESLRYQVISDIAMLCRLGLSPRAVSACK